MSDIGEFLGGPLLIKGVDVEIGPPPAPGGVLYCCPVVMPENTPLFAGVLTVHAHNDWVHGLFDIDTPKQGEIWKCNLRKNGIMWIAFPVEKVTEKN
jgi:hypothetical protein